MLLSLIKYKLQFNILTVIYFIVPIQGQNDIDKRVTSGELYTSDQEYVEQIFDSSKNIDLRDILQVAQLDALIRINSYEHYPDIYYDLFFWISIWGTPASCGFSFYYPILALIVE